MSEVPNVVNLDEAVIPLRVTHQVIDRLAKKAQFSGFDSVEKLCVFIIMKSLETKVGAPSIEAPNQIAGLDAQKITGPKGGIVSRA